MRILGLPSALHPKAISRILLKYGDEALKRSLLHPQPYLDIADIASLPLFDAHKYTCEMGFPKEVRAFRDQLENSGAVLFSTNEQQHR